MVLVRTHLCAPSNIYFTFSDYKKRFIVLVYFVDISSSISIFQDTLLCLTIEDFRVRKPISAYIFSNMYVACRYKDIL